MRTERQPSEVLLVGPYKCDRLESIERYVRSLQQGLSGHLSVRVISPAPVFGRFAGRSHQASAKWLGYWDKYVRFPGVLAAEIQKRPVPVHICDQGAAPANAQLAHVPHLLTCFDFIAIRSARGEFPAHRTRWSGRRLQSMILNGIRRAEHVACISDATMRDLLRLTGRKSETVSVIPLALDPAFHPASAVDCRRVLQRGLPDAPYILHVGGNQWYKNRPGVFAIFREVARQYSAPLNLVLAGKPITPELKLEIREAGLSARVFNIPDARDEELRALYSGARLLLFPSLAEGFGWPVLEAQACGCPVAASNIPPLTEVAGPAAVFFSPTDPAGAARAVCNLLCEPDEMIAKRIARGQRHAERFTAEPMIQSYLELYTQLFSRRYSARLLESV